MHVKVGNMTEVNLKSSFKCIDQYACVVFTVMCSGSSPCSDLAFESQSNAISYHPHPFTPNVVNEHLTLSITQMHTGAFAKYVSRISDGAP